MTGVVETVQLLHQLGSAIGGLFLPYLGDRFGRKYLFCFCCMTSILVEVVVAFTPYIYIVEVLFFIQGICVGTAISTCLIIGTELLIPSHRQVFGIMHFAGWALGNTAFHGCAYLLEDYGWRSLQLAGAAVGFAVLTFPFLLYESPRWLAANDKWDQALDILEKASKLNGTDVVEVQRTFEEYKVCEMLKKEQRKRFETNSFKLKDRNDENLSERRSSLSFETNNEGLSQTHDTGTIVGKVSIFSMFFRRDILVLTLALWFIHMSGYLIYYGIYLSSSTLVGNRFLNATLMSLTELPSSLIVLYLMSKIGRILISRIFLVLAGTLLLVLTLLTQLGGDSPVNHNISIALSVVSLFTFLSAMMSVYIVSAEVYPTVIRNAGFGLCQSVPRIGGMLAPYSRPLHAILPWAPGTIFSIFSFLSALATFGLPETKDTILTTDITEIRSKNMKKWKGDNNIKNMIHSKETGIIA